MNGSWKQFLDQLDDAVIVIDQRRVLQHVNDAARRLLGYELGQTVGGRCKLTTRGVDCENACPLTFALEAGLERVEDFATVYQTKDGRSVRLRVTVVPLTDDDGSFHGAVEILRPSDPEPGFYMSGCTEAADGMRQRAHELARNRADVLVVGEAPACRDVASAIHRFSGCRLGGCGGGVRQEAGRKDPRPRGLIGRAAGRRCSRGPPGRSMPIFARRTCSCVPSGPKAGG